MSLRPRRTLGWLTLWALLGATSGAAHASDPQAGLGAAAPRVAVTLAPAHGLAARVMAGVGAPELIIRPGASPHGYALRPSEAEALQAAEVVVWIGPALEPWLERPLAALAKTARLVTLQDAPGAVRLAARADGVWAQNQNHGHGHDHGHDHAQGSGDATLSPIDPHLWLDPGNAAAWTRAIAEALAAADPGRADVYRANAEAAVGEIAALDAEIAARLAPVRAKPFVVFHDAYQYFEAHYGLAAAGAVALSDAAPAGPRHLAELRARMAEAGVACLFTEPQFAPSLAAALLDGTSMRSGVLDPLGAAIEPGPAFYPALMRALADDLRACLEG